MKKKNITEEKIFNGKHPYSSVYKLEYTPKEFEKACAFKPLDAQIWGNLWPPLTIITTSNISSEKNSPNMPSKINDNIIINAEKTIVSENMALFKKHTHDSNTHRISLKNNDEKQSKNAIAMKNRINGNTERIEELISVVNKIQIDSCTAKNAKTFDLANEEMISKNVILERELLNCNRIMIVSEKKVEEIGVELEEKKRELFHLKRENKQQQKNTMDIKQKMLKLQLKCNEDKADNYYWKEMYEEFSAKTRRKLESNEKVISHLIHMQDIKVQSVDQYMQTYALILQTTETQTNLNAVTIDYELKRKENIINNLLLQNAKANTCEKDMQTSDLILRTSETQTDLNGIAIDEQLKKSIEKISAMERKSADIILEFEISLEEKRASFVLENETERKSFELQLKSKEDVINGLRVKLDEKIAIDKQWKEIYENSLQIEIRNEMNDQQKEFERNFIKKEIEFELKLNKHLKNEIQMKTEIEDIKHEMKENSVILEMECEKRIEEINCRLQFEIEQNHDQKILFNQMHEENEMLKTDNIEILDKVKNEYESKMNFKQKEFDDNLEQNASEYETKLNENNLRNEKQTKSEIEKIANEMKIENDEELEKIEEQINIAIEQRNSDKILNEQEIKTIEEECERRMSVKQNEFDEHLTEEATNYELRLSENIFKNELQIKSEMKRNQSLNIQHIKELAIVGNQLKLEIEKKNTQQIISEQKYNNIKAKYEILNARNIENINKMKKEFEIEMSFKQNEYKENFVEIRDKYELELNENNLKNTLQMKSEIDKISNEMKEKNEVLEELTEAQNQLKTEIEEKRKSLENVRFIHSSFATEKGNQQKIFEEKIDICKKNISDQSSIIQSLNIKLSENSTIIQSINKQLEDKNNNILELETKIKCHEKLYIEKLDECKEKEKSMKFCMNTNLENMKIDHENIMKITMGELNESRAQQFKVIQEMKNQTIVNDKNIQELEEKFRLIGIQNASNIYIIQKQKQNEKIISQLEKELQNMREKKIINDGNDNIIKHHSMINELQETMKMNDIRNSNNIQMYIIERQNQNEKISQLKNELQNIQSKILQMSEEKDNLSIENRKISQKSDAIVLDLRQEITQYKTESENMRDVTDIYDKKNTNLETVITHLQEKNAVHAQMEVKQNKTMSELKSELKNELKNMREKYISDENVVKNHMEKQQLIINELQKTMKVKDIQNVSDIQLYNIEKQNQNETIIQLKNESRNMQNTIQKMNDDKDNFSVENNKKSLKNEKIIDELNQELVQHKIELENMKEKSISNEHDQQTIINDLQQTLKMIDIQSSKITQMYNIGKQKQNETISELKNDIQNMKNTISQMMEEKDSLSLENEKNLRKSHKIIHHLKQEIMQKELQCMKQNTIIEHENQNETESESIIINSDKKLDMEDIYHQLSEDLSSSNDDLSSIISDNSNDDDENTNTINTDITDITNDVNATPTTTDTITPTNITQESRTWMETSEMLTNLLSNKNTMLTDLKMKLEISKKQITQLLLTDTDTTPNTCTNTCSTITSTDVTTDEMQTLDSYTNMIAYETYKKEKSQRKIITYLKKRMIILQDIYRKCYTLVQKRSQKKNQNDIIKYLKLLQIIIKNVQLIIIEKRKKINSISMNLDMNLGLNFVNIFQMGDEDENMEMSMIEKKAFQALQNMYLCYAADNKYIYTSDNKKLLFLQKESMKHLQLILKCEV